MIKTQDRPLTIGDLIEYVKSRNIPLESTIFIRPENAHLFFVGEVGTGTFSPSNEEGFPVLVMTCHGAKPLKLENIPKGLH